MGGEAGRELITSELAFWLGVLLAGNGTTSASSATATDTPDDGGPADWAPMQSALKTAWRSGWAQGSLDEWSSSVLKRVAFKIVPVANIVARKAAERGDPCAAGGAGAGAAGVLGAAEARVLSHLVDTLRPQAVVSLRSGGPVGVHLPAGHPDAAAANEALERIAELTGAYAAAGAGVAAAAAAAAGPGGPLALTWHIYGSGPSGGGGAGTRGNGADADATTKTITKDALPATRRLVQTSANPGGVVRGSALDAALGRAAAAAAERGDKPPPLDLKHADGSLLAETSDDPRLPGSTAAKAAAAKPREPVEKGDGLSADAAAAADTAAAAAADAAAADAAVKAADVGVVGVVGDLGDAGSDTAKKAADAAAAIRNVAAEKGTITDHRDDFRGPDGLIDLEETVHRHRDDEDEDEDAPTHNAKETLASTTAVGHRSTVARSAGASTAGAAATGGAPPPPPRCARDFGPMEADDYEATLAAWLSSVLVLGDHLAAHPRASSADAHAMQGSQPEPKTPPTKQDLALRGGGGAGAAVGGGDAVVGVTSRGGSSSASSSAAAAQAAGGASDGLPRQPGARAGAAQAGSGLPDHPERAAAARAASGGAAAAVDRAAVVGGVADAGLGRRGGRVGDPLDARRGPPPPARRRLDDDPRGGGWLTALGAGACVGAAAMSAWRALGPQRRPGGALGVKARAA